MSGIRVIQLLICLFSEGQRLRCRRVEMVASGCGGRHCGSIADTNLHYLAAVQVQPKSYNQGLTKAANVAYLLQSNSAHQNSHIPEEQTQKNLEKKK